MTHFPHGAMAAVHAAEEERKRIENEEEEMTKYNSEELEGNWEFKIVRAATPAFRRPEVFQALMDEESMAGWEMVEKLDDNRVRFKRRREARRKDAALPPGFDPYRTQYGRPVKARAIVLGFVFSLLLGGIIAYNITSEVSSSSMIWLTAVIILALMVVFGLVVFGVTRARRG